MKLLIHEHTEACDCGCDEGAEVAFDCDCCGKTTMMIVAPGRKIDLIYCRCGSALRIRDSDLREHG